MINMLISSPPNSMYVDHSLRPNALTLPKCTTWRSFVSALP